MSTGTLGRVYENGEVLCKQGEVGDTMFVIQEGDVEVVIERAGRETLLHTAHAGEMLGEMAIFLHEARSATLRAKGQARVLTVDKKNFLRRINEDPSIAFRIVEFMSRRIRELSKEVADLKQARPDHVL
jgi:CRP/FNR family transcriptional regulator, cyclic AMP receptor protein